MHLDTSYECLSFFPRQTKPVWTARVLALSKQTEEGSDLNGLIAQQLCWGTLVLPAFCRGFLFWNTAEMGKSWMIRQFLCIILWWMHICWYLLGQEPVTGSVCVLLCHSHWSCQPVTQEPQMNRMRRTKISCLYFGVTLNAALQDSEIFRINRFFFLISKATQLSTIPDELMAMPEVC